jgi:predicted TPR repeat methyltransferase
VENLEYAIPERISKVLREIMHNTPTDLNTLDIGCGTGLCGVFLRNLSSHMKGVDLSEKMLEQAKMKNIYDELECSDMVETMLKYPGTYNLVVSADVFIYTGYLDKAFEACHLCLKENGLFIFSVESVEDTQTVVLRSSARYAHSRRYIESLAHQYKFRIEHMETLPIRMEEKLPVEGYLVALRKHDMARALAG